MVAPGEDIYSTIYDYEKKSTFMSLDGTSMASPMVAGIVSLILSKYPQVTPTQVEYILEHSANDLEAEGYDTKYGNGLVDPVKALQYNIKSLPSLTKTKWNEQEIKDHARKVETKEKVTLNDNIVKSFEEKWYKTDVKKGDHVQFELEGASQFDYKLMLYLESKDRKDRVEVRGTVLLSPGVTREPSPCLLPSILFSCHEKRMNESKKFCGIFHRTFLSLFYLLFRHLNIDR